MKPLVGKAAMHILIVEDDPVVADVLGMTLEEAGHFQSTAHNIETALAELKHNTVDAVLLDINLPDGDGTRLARLIRKNHMPLPILVVSGNASTDDKIAALGAGADGYLTKPFDRFELLANLDAIIRRTHGHSSATVSVGNLEVDLNRHMALIEGHQLQLTGKEFRIVEFLALRKGVCSQQDSLPQPSLWRHGRAGAKNHRCLYLQAAAQAGNCRCPRDEHRYSLRPRLYLARNRSCQPDTRSPANLD